jgi:putative SOS response-associated peptidase YedK
VPRWLDPTTTDAHGIVDLLRPYPASELELRPVSRRVGSPDHEGPELIRRDDSIPELWS